MRGRAPESTGKATKESPFDPIQLDSKEASILEEEKEGKL